MNGDPSALSGVLGFLVMGALFYGLLRFAEWCEKPRRRR